MDLSMRLKVKYWLEGWSSLIVCIAGLWLFTTMEAKSLFLAEFSFSSDTLTIVAFGNSITATRATVSQVFAQRLPNLLSVKGISCRVINAGIGGSHTGRMEDHGLFKIAHARDRFESDVLARNPDITLIGFGTNDAYIDAKVKGGLSRIPLEDYRKNLIYLIINLQKVGSKIILITPNILGEEYPDFQNQRMLKYVRVVRRLAGKFKTGLVDNYRLFKKYGRQEDYTIDDLLLDGVHPNDKGHTLIAKELSKEIVEILGFPGV